MTSKDVSVGLLIFSKIKGELVAILQIRGEHNFERGFKPESWPGACQLTIHGRIEAQETKIEALLRESEEELGHALADWLRENQDKITPLNSRETSGKVIKNHCIIIPSKLISRIRLHPSSGGLRLLKEENLDSVVNLMHTFSKETGVTNRLFTAMFGDEIEALRQGFSYFNK